MCLACVASVFVGFGRSERPRNGIFGILPARRMGRDPKNDHPVILCSRTVLKRLLRGVKCVSISDFINQHRFLPLLLLLLFFFYQFPLRFSLFDCICLTHIHTFQRSSRSGQTWYFVFNLFNKLTSVFYACVCPVIDHEFRHHIIKVAVDNFKFMCLTAC